MDEEDATIAAPAQVDRKVEPLRGLWDAFVRGWRPFGGWICILILFVRGAIIPVVQLYRNEAIEPLDWVALTALMGLLGLGHFRSRERVAGVTG